MTPSLLLVLPALFPVALDDEGPARYMRLVEEPEGLHLEMAVRSFAKEGAPAVQLAAAIHVGEPEYYRALQERLDGLDLVLFESVRPPGTGDPRWDLTAEAERDDRWRVGITRARVRFAASLVHRYHAARGEWPTELAELPDALPRDLAVLAADALLDGWGRPLRLAAAPEASGFEAWLQGPRAFDVQSLGADGRPGGEGADADLAYADQSRLSSAERGEGGGIQQDIAEALGLVFQLDAMDHARPNWRNSDLSIDQVQVRIGGVDGLGEADDDLFGALRGEGFVARAAGFALKLLTRLPYGRAAMRVAGVEILARADEVLEAAPGELGGMLDVILYERNAVVVADLADALEEGHETIGVLYGAGHMRDLEQRLVTELGYAPSGTEWIRAASVRYAELDLDRDQVRLLRKTVAQALEDALGGR